MLAENLHVLPLAVGIAVKEKGLKLDSGTKVPVHLMYSCWRGSNEILSFRICVLQALPLCLCQLGDDEDCHERYPLDPLIRVLAKGALEEILHIIQRVVLFTPDLLRSLLGKSAFSIPTSVH